MKEKQKRQGGTKKKRAPSPEIYKNLVQPTRTPVQDNQQNN